MKAPAWLENFGWVAERKAFALASLAIYMSLFGFFSVLAHKEMPEWVPMLVGMAAIYAIAFFSVAAEWFWGRWFASGIGYWGLSGAVMSAVASQAVSAPLIFFGVSHAVVVLCLGGTQMAKRFEANPEWQKRWKIRDETVKRLKKSITRAASSLPALVMFVLAPKQPHQLWLLGLVGAGMFMTLRGRTIGILLLVASGLMGALAVGFSATLHTTSFYDVAGGVATVLLWTAVLPFFQPLTEYLRKK